jgi:hypothetical protein
MDKTAKRQHGKTARKPIPYFCELDIYQDALAAEDSPIRFR